MDKMSNMMTYSFFIIPAIFLLVIGGHGSAKIVPTACDFSQDQAWKKGYNDGVSDNRNGLQSNEISRSIQPCDDYKAGYSQGYADASMSLETSC